MELKTVNIMGMKESKDYSSCPYCSTPEPDIPGLKEVNEELSKAVGQANYFSLQADLMKDIPMSEYYEVNGIKYPFTANHQSFNDAYALCHFGVTDWWNEIHCCPNCKREYFTVHEH